jgi:hypothetical protein
MQRLVMTLAVAALGCFNGAGNGRAETTNSLWLAETVTPLFITDSLFTNAPAPYPSALLLGNPRPLTLLRDGHASKAQKRWYKFHSEFQEPRGNPANPLSTVATAKYMLDWASLEFRDWADTIKESMSFDYEIRNLTRDAPATLPPRRIRDSVFLDAWENARFQSDIRISSRGFVGVKLTLPLGD